jgi:hypothetical protein
MENMTPAEKILHDAENHRYAMTPTQIGQIFILAAELSEKGALETNFTEFVRLHQTHERAQEHIEKLMDMINNEHSDSPMDSPVDDVESNELYESIKNNFKRFIK